MFLPHPRVKVSIVGSLRDREVACSASDRQGSNFESCVWRTVSSQSSHQPQEALLAQFSLYVHKGGLKPDSFHYYSSEYPWDNRRCSVILSTPGQRLLNAGKYCINYLSHRKQCKVSKSSDYFLHRPINTPRAAVVHLFRPKRALTACSATFILAMRSLSIFVTKREPQNKYSCNKTKLLTIVDTISICKGKNVFFLYIDVNMKSCETSSSCADGNRGPIAQYITRSMVIGYNI